MKLQIPEHIQSLVPYQPGKPIEETQREYGLQKVIKLASNENPLGPSPKALQAIQRGMNELHRYPDSAAYQFKNALSKHTGVEPSHLSVGNGSNEHIDLLVRGFCVPGDGMVTSHAAFVAYRICAQIHGVQTIETPLTEDFRFDLEKMFTAVEKNPQVKIAFIANPNNPTGTYVGTHELTSFLKKIQSLKNRSVLVVLDSAYWEYVNAQDLPDPIQLQRQFSNVVVLRTFSKAYGLAGLRIGYCIADPEIISIVERIRPPFNVSSFALAAGMAALEDGLFVKKAVELNHSEMKVWELELKQMKVPFLKSQGNFILVDVQAGFEMSGVELFQECLKKGVILRPVANYGLKDHIRISIGTAEENLTAIKVLRGLKK